MNTVTKTLPVLIAAALLYAPAAAPASTNTVVTVGGTGVAGSSGDGGPVIAATFNAPRAMARLSDGTVLVVDTGNNKIRAIAPNGVVTTAVGTGASGSSGDGGAATAAQLNGPRDVAVAPDGSTYYIADYSNHRIRKVSGGTITTVVGNGTASSTGDFGPSAAATVNAPAGIDVAANGDLYIAEVSGHRIRRVLANGSGQIDGTTLTYTVAGSGSAGNAGDGGPAVSATLNQPNDVLLFADGSFLIADYNNGRIRRVDVFGTIQNVLSGGCGNAVYLCGDGGFVNAPTAQGSAPVLLTSDNAGGYLIIDYGINRVRRVTSSGVMTTVMGTGAACAATTNRCGDGQASELAEIGQAKGVLMLPDGTILVADANNRIRARLSDPNTAPQGPNGPTGPQGPNGPTGPAGGAGATGAAGAAGNTGANGPDGAAGSAGSQGATGAGGTTGAQGAAGKEGQRGRDGLSLVPFAVVLTSDRVRVKGSAATSLPLFVSRAGRLTIRISRGGKTRTVRAQIDRAGRKKVNLKRLARGTYKLTVTLTQGTSKATDKATLIVR